MKIDLSADFDLDELEIGEISTTPNDQTPTTPQPPAGMFSLSKNHFLRQFHESKAKDKTNRRGVKRFIHPENARGLLPYLPDQGDTTHAIVRGDFVLGEIIPVILRNKPADCVAIATLGMSEANAKMLAGLRDRGMIRELHLVVSHYFASVDATSTFAKVCQIIGPHAPTVTRSHAKVIIIIQPPNFYTVAGSANLRSSDNIEQFAIWNDPEVADFHLNWMKELIKNKP
jgi:hypothetical protein